MRVASCPCAGPGSTGGGPGTKPAPRPKRLPALFQGKCRRGRLPDRACSPGEAATTNADRVCRPGYSERVRNVSERTKNSVYYRYGIRRHPAGHYEVDHIISLELGGSNSIRNLYPEAADPRPGFHEKDRLENTLHSLVCAGDLDIRAAQKAIASNWLTAYRRYVGSAAVSTGLPRVLTQDARQPFALRPATIGYTGDGTGFVGGSDGTSVRHPGHLRWTTYTSRRGVGAGVVWLDDCDPSCAERSFSAHPVAVYVSRPRAGHFTRLTLRFRADGKAVRDTRGVRYYPGSGGYRGYWAYYVVSTSW